MRRKRRISERRVTVAADAADAYLQIRGDQARLKSRRTADRDRAPVARPRRLRKCSGIADRETAQAEALLAQAEGAVPLLRAALEAQMNRLDVLMGAQPGADAAEISDAAPLPAIPRMAAAAADLRRLPTHRRRARLAAASARIGEAIAESTPSCRCPASSATKP